jgi:amino acid adenylation domain-containing protein
VVLPRGRATVVALGAVAWLGAAWVPADPAWPRSRREEVFHDAGARVVVGDGGEPALVSDALAAEALSGEAPPPSARADGLAYILYTSGSTGRPKGVAVSHRALSANLAALDRALGLRAPRWLSVTSLAFDISIAELLLPLLAGGTLHLVSDATARDGLRLRARVEAVDPDWLQATPGTWRMLLNAGWAGAPRLSAISGGETLPRPLADALRERCGALWNAYGPTEATIWATLARVDGEVTIGRPLPGYQLRQQGEELWIGGPALAEGYWRDPDRTAAAFVTHGGARWYRTGDAVELLPDGRWSYRGRLDQQIKLHGVRVEPGEVEAALVALPGVREAVVRPHRGALVAFVTGALPADAGPRLAEHLPAHMVPARFVALDAFPRLVSGKIDRGALVPPEEPSTPLDTGAPPRRRCRRCCR